MRAQRRRRHLLIALIAVFALLAAACSDGNEGGDASGGTAPQATAAPSDDSESAAADQSAPAADDVQDEQTAPADDPDAAIKLMTLGSITGPIGLPELRDSAEAAVAAINASGGVHGRPIELLVCDDETNPNLAVECGRQAAEENVVAVVGANSAFGNEYMSVLIETQIPSVGNVSRSQTELSSPFSFPLGGGIAVSLVGIGYGLGEYGATKIHAAIPATGNAAALGGIFINAGLAPFGLSLDGQTGFPLDAADLTPLVQATLEGGTDGVAFLMAPDQINKYLLALPNLGADPLLVSSTLVYSDTNFGIVGDAAEGLILTGQILPPTYTENPGVQRYHDELDAIGSDAPRSELGMNTWAAFHIVADIMNSMEADAIDSESLMAVMNSAGEIRFDPLPPFDWSEPILAYPPARRVFSDRVVVSEVRDGKIVAVTGEYVSLSE